MKKRKKIRKRETMVPVASMGDIAFLLIIFFVICSQFQEVDIDPAKSLDVTEITEKPKVRVEIDADGKIYFQGMLADNPGEIKWRVEEMVTKPGITEAGKIVTFRCDKAVPRKQFEPVLEAIAKAGGIIAAMGEKGEPAAKVEGKASDKTGGK